MSERTWCACQSSPKTTHNSRQMITSPQNVLNRSRSAWTTRYRRSRLTYRSRPPSHPAQSHANCSVRTVAYTVTIVPSRYRKKLKKSTRGMGNEMQNDEWRMQNQGNHSEDGEDLSSIQHSAFCILHSAFCVTPRPTPHGPASCRRRAGCRS